MSYAGVGRLVRGRAVGYRGLAVAAGAALTLSYLSVLYHVVDVVSETGLPVFLVVVAGSLALAVGLAGTLTPARALVVGAGLLAAGILAYRLTLPTLTVDIAWQIEGTAALFTGWSVLHLAKAGNWAIGLAPAPVFLSWYFLLRRRYAAGALIGLGTLGFFLLSGDAGSLTGLVGAVGALGMVGFGRLERQGGTDRQRNALLSLLLIVLLVTTSISLVPGGEARPLLPDSDSPTIEASLVGTGDSIDVVGSIRLSSTARFNVTAERASYWRVGAFDRYTGDGWVRTGSTREYDGPLSTPPVEATRLEQRIEVRSEMSVMPAAWKPRRVSIGADRARVTGLGGLRPEGTFEAGESYSVTSLVPRRSEAALRRAEGPDPPGIRERYRQVPESTPDRVGRLAANITADAETRYDAAVAIERYLQANKEYSLDVREPNGDIASSFLFRMDAGYCTYFATTMAVMLRTQEIPARFVVGYTPGERVDENTWVVRGLDSHAWVEVYFPDRGWVRFDPTPGGPRRAAENTRVDRAESADIAADTRGGGSVGRTGLATPTPSTPDLATTPVENANTSPPDGSQFGPGAGPGLEQGAAITAGSEVNAGGGGPPLPTRETVLYGAILVAGVAAIGHRTGVADRLYRALWVRRDPEGDPRERVEAAMDRLEYLLGQRYRPRQGDESRREYIEALGEQGRFGEWSLDERVLTLYELYERAAYAGRVDEKDAATAVRLLRELREEF